MKSITIEDLLDYSYLSNLKYSDDGKSLVFVLTKANKENNNYDSYLYLYRDNKIRQLTSFGKESSYIFKNNNELYIFTSRSEEEKKKAESFKQFTPVYTIKLDGGEAIKKFELPIRAFNVKILNDNQIIFLSSYDKQYPDYYKLSDKEKELIDKQIKDDLDYEIFDEVPYYFNGMGFIKNQRTGLFIYDLKTKKLDKINNPKYSVGDYEIYDNRIYYTYNNYETLRDRKSGIVYYDLKTSKNHNIMEPKYGIYTIEKFNDRLLVLVNRRLKYGLNENPIMYSLDPKTNKLVIFNDEDISYGNSSGSDTRYGGGKMCKTVGDKFYFLETRVNDIVLAYFDENGKKHDVYKGEGSIDDFDIYEDNFVFNLLKADSPQELYTFKNNKLKRISNFNQSVIKNKYVAKYHKESIKSANYNIDGWVLYPKDFDPKKKYPAILDIHGGPKTIYGEFYYHEMQVWANRGYFVFLCNPYGSDGKGNKFMYMHDKYGTTDYKNIMDFTDHILKKYKNINPKKVCVTGGSYGGFMTNWIVGHTDRFVAAATQRSISNWISFYGVSDIGLDFTKDQAGGSLKDLDTLWNHSPLKYVSKVKTPILFIHSDQDYRCPLEQGLQFYSSITENGIDTRFVLFHGENHELSRSGKPLHRIKRLKEISEWFDKYTK